MIDPYLKAMWMVVAALALLGGFGLYWAKQEREEFRTRHHDKQSK